MKKDFLKCEYDSVGRIYNFSDSSKYSVTTMLSNTKDDKFLKEWRKRVGEREARRITENAGIIGTSLHKCCEDHLLCKEVVPENTLIRNLYNQIRPYLKQRIVKVYHTEHILYSDIMQLAGAVDAVVDYIVKGIPNFVILDFKTANRQKKIEYLEDYFLQLCCYSKMYEEMYNEKAKKGVLLFAYKQQRSPFNEVVVNLEKYEYKLMKRIELFHEKVAKSL